MFEPCSLELEGPIHPRYPTRGAEGGGHPEQGTEGMDQDRAAHVHKLSGGQPAQSAQGEDPFIKGIEGQEQQHPQQQVLGHGESPEHGTCGDQQAGGRKF